MHGRYLSAIASPHPAPVIQTDKLDTRPHAHRPTQILLCFLKEDVIFKSERICFVFSFVSIVRSANSSCSFKPSGAANDTGESRSFQSPREGLLSLLLLYHHC